MNNLQNISIILSFAGLWITSLFSGDFEIVLGFMLILSFGILHGSNDIILIHSIAKSRASITFIRVLLTYILTIGIAVIVFYFFPLIALILFIIFSAFHFGQQHWEYHELSLKNSSKNLIYFSYGMLVLQLLFVFNINDVIIIVENISNVTLEEHLIHYSFLASVILFLCCVALIYLKLKEFKSKLIKEIFLLLVFIVIFKVSTLIWGFTIYFIFWHSIPSLIEQVRFIYGEFDQKTFLSYCKNALPYWIISVIGISVMYFIFKNETLFLALFFSFIAAVTFPHTLVMNKMFGNKKAQPN